MKTRNERREKLDLIKLKILKRPQHQELREGGWWCHWDSSYKSSSGRRIKLERGWVPLPPKEVYRRTRKAYRNEGRKRGDERPGCGWGCPICDPNVGRQAKARATKEYERRLIPQEVEEYWRETRPQLFHDYVDPYDRYEDFWDNDWDEYLVCWVGHCQCYTLRDLNRLNNVCRHWRWSHKYNRWVPRN